MRPVNRAWVACSFLLFCVSCGGPVLSDAGIDSGHTADGGPPPAVCGNGTLEAGEQCDDGNIADGDGCESYCGTCGDGVHAAAGEACDSGATDLEAEPIDGCNARCERSGTLAWAANLDSASQVVVLDDGSVLVVGTSSSDRVNWSLDVERLNADGSSASRETVAIPDVDTDLRIQDAIAIDAGRLVAAGWEYNGAPIPWIAEISVSPLSIRVLSIPPFTPEMHTGGFSSLALESDRRVVAIGWMRLGGDRQDVRLDIRNTAPLETDIVMSPPRPRDASPGQPAMLTDGTWIIPYDEGFAGDTYLVEFAPSGATAIYPTDDVVQVAASLPDDRLMLAGKDRNTDRWWIQEYDRAASALIGPRYADTREPILSTVSFMEADAWGGVVFLGWQQTSTRSEGPFFEGNAVLGRIDSGGALSWWVDSTYSIPRDFVFSHSFGVAVALLSRDAEVERRPYQVEVRLP